MLLTPKIQSLTDPTCLHFFPPTNYVKITILIIIIQFEHGMREMELNNYCTNLINSGPVIDPWGTP